MGRICVHIKHFKLVCVVKEWRQSETSMDNFRLLSFSSRVIFFWCSFIITLSIVFFFRCHTATNLTVWLLSFDPLRRLISLVGAQNACQIERAQNFRFSGRKEILASFDFGIGKSLPLLSRLEQIFACIHQVVVLEVYVNDLHAERLQQLDFRIQPIKLKNKTVKALTCLKSSFLFQIKTCFSIANFCGFFVQKFKFAEYFLLFVIFLNLVLVELVSIHCSSHLKQRIVEHDPRKCVIGWNLQIFNVNPALILINRQQVIVDYQTSCRFRLAYVIQKTVQIAYCDKSSRFTVIF